MDKELMPCPFCGCEDIVVMRDPTIIFERYFAMCDCCYVQIHRGTHEEVIEAWNRRVNDG